jgi:hypothetical protein
MQQTTPPPAPAPLAPPATPQAPTPSILLPSGPIPLEALPQTPQEVRGLRERREILRDHLERATNRRANLVEQLEGDGMLSQDARSGVQQRLNAIDQRILQLESDQAATERLLSNAPPAVLARATVESRVESAVTDEDVVATGFGTFGLGVILTMFVGRLWRRRPGRRGGTSPTVAALPDDPRIERLAQAVDSIAVEVERIGEGQRFVTQLLAGRQETRELLAAERAPVTERR